MTVSELCKTAKLNSSTISTYAQSKVNALLQNIASAIRTNVYFIIDENARDVDACTDGPQFVDRIRLSREGVEGLARKLERLMGMNSPLGETLERFQTANGMEFAKVCVPMGTVGILFDDLSSTLVEGIGMCLKTGNAVVLIGSEHITNTLRAIVKVVKESISTFHLEPDFIQLLECNKRNLSDFLHANDSIDVVLCKGGKALRTFVKDNATVPVIMTGGGNCQMYVECSANVLMATNLIVNAVTYDSNADNACKGIVVDEVIARSFLPFALGILREKGFTVKGDKKAKSFVPDLPLAGEKELYGEKYGKIVTVKVVRDISDAIFFINQASGHLSDAIVTKNISFAEKFLNEVDSAVVYVNASTCFTNGYEFGIGEDMGISVQKLHVRGPVGLRELTSTKYQVVGNGQTKN